MACWSAVWEVRDQPMSLDAQLVHTGESSASNFPGNLMGNCPEVKHPGECLEWRNFLGSNCFGGTCGETSGSPCRITINQSI